MPSVLITGSFAFDTIMVFPDAFKNHILADKMHILNVCFMVPEIRKEFGGCAGNIAFNLKLIGGNPLPMGTVGEDFQLYRNWLNELEIPDDLVREIKQSYTAQAYLTTDIDDNQIIAFHPGAMELAHSNTVEMALAAQDISLGIVAPDGKQAMIEHAEQFAAHNIPFFFDPGQGLPMFSGEELTRFIELANYVVVNDYESEMLVNNSGLSLSDIAQRCEALIITRGSKGAEIQSNGETITIPVAKTEAILDPTGCGDAFRAGLIYGVCNQLDWRTSGQIASLIAAIKIEHHGTQNHRFDETLFKSRYLDSFGEPLDIAIDCSLSTRLQAVKPQSDSPT